MQPLGRVAEFTTNAMRKRVTDPIHYPIGATLIPATATLLFVWMAGNLLWAAAVGRIILNPFWFLLIAPIFLAFVGVVFWAGEMSYRWRMALRDQHRGFYRVSQVWRVVIGLFFVVSIVSLHMNPARYTMPSNPVTGPMPVWMFYLIFLSLGAAVSIGTSVVVHPVMWLLNRGQNGRDSTSAREI